MKLTTMFGALFGAMLLTFTVACDKDPDHAHEGGGMDRELPKEAVCVLRGMKDHTGVSGTLTLSQTDGGVAIKGTIRGLTEGKHGFHIHQWGDLRDPAGNSAGGHYSANDHQHGAPGTNSHSGDLGNVTANADGVANVDITAADLKLHFVIGRSIVVHAGVDDLKSQPSGNAGPRAGVGVIGYAEIK